LAHLVTDEHRSQDEPHEDRYQHGEENHRRSAHLVARQCQILHFGGVTKLVDLFVKVVTLSHA
jgi:hypothetical protein